MSLIAELQRRKVFKVGAAYLVVAWLSVQAVSIAFPAFDAPPWALRVFILLVMLGFPITLVMTWIFDVTPEGVQVDARAPGGKRVFTGAALLIALALGWYFYGQPSFRKGDAITPAASRSQPSASPDTGASRRIAATDHSIAVLPFLNMSSDKEQDYFSDGLSEELLNQLAQIRQLRVIARTSSFSFKGKEVDVATIARILNVANVLEGSVRKSGNTLRITAQLIRASDSSHLWSKTYDREMTDIFKVQDEIAGEVVAALKLTLLQTPLVTNAQRTSNTEAYEQYLIGQQYSRRGGPEAAQSAVAAFQHALALDPQYAAAYASLAAAQSGVAEFAASPAKRAEEVTQAFATVERAIALGPDLPNGYRVRGTLRYRLAWDWKGAQEDFQKALALDPNDVLTLTIYAHSLFFNGRQAEAIEADRKAIQIDPLSDGAWAGYGWHLFASGHVPEARSALQRALDINPNTTWPPFLLGYCDLKAGKSDSALAFFRRAPGGHLLAGTAMTEYTLGHALASQQALDELKEKYAVGFAYQVAQVYTWRGEKDRAFEWLDRAYEQHDAGMPRLRYDPTLASLRDDPRFAALVNKMGFPK